MAKKVFEYGDLLNDKAPLPAPIEGVTLRGADPAPVPVETAPKRRRGAPKRAFRGEDARRLSIELPAEVYEEFQMIGIKRKEKLQAMGERAILEFMRKYK